ncbi:MAG: hypothetical protein NTV21_09845 [Planctomycetota bacterium]|nr:hypothetical protein [Planctomycetota bacterium]
MQLSGLAVALTLLASAPFQSTPPAPPPPASAPAPGTGAWVIASGSEDRPGGTLARFDLATGTVERAIDLPFDSQNDHQPLEVVLLPDGKSALVARLVQVSPAKQVTLVQTVSLADGKESSSTQFSGWLDSLEFHPKTGELWATQIDGQLKLVRVKLKRGELDVVAEFQDDLTPRSLAFTRDGKQLWCLSATNEAKKDELVELDPADGKVLRRIPWGIEHPAHALDVDASGRLLALAWGGTLHEFDARSGRSRALFTFTDHRLGIPVGLELERPAAAKR